MRSTVRSVGAPFGSGSRCLNSLMTVAFAQARSERSASIVGASLVLMRPTRAVGRVESGVATGGVSAAASAAKAPPEPAQKVLVTAAAAKAATIQLLRTVAVPPDSAPAAEFSCRRNDRAVFI